MAVLCCVNPPEASPCVADGMRRVVLLSAALGSTRQCVAQCPLGAGALAACVSRGVREGEELGSGAWFACLDFVGGFAGVGSRGGRCFVFCG